MNPNPSKTGIAIQTKEIKTITCIFLKTKRAGLIYMGKICTIIMLRHYHTILIRLTNEIN